MTNSTDSEEGLDWTDEAINRLECVPKGFMRNMTKKRIEKYANEINATKITLDVAEHGINGAKGSMSSMMGGEFSSNKKNENKVEPKNNFVIDRNIDYFVCDICGYTVKGYPLDECPICRSDKKKFKLAKDKDLYVTRSSGRVLDWTKKAANRLTNTPEGFMRDMTKWRIEAFVRKSGALEVTVELIEKKYAHWGEGSKNIAQELDWNDDAKEKINKIPEVVRGMVIKEVENEAKRAGVTTVSQEILSKVREKWSNSMEFHSDLQDLMPPSK